jgi:hypothetical protein
MAGRGPRSTLIVAIEGHGSRKEVLGGMSKLNTTRWIGIGLLGLPLYGAL